MNGKKGVALLGLYCLGIFLIVVVSYFMIRHYMAE